MILRMRQRLKRQFHQVVERLRTPVPSLFKNAPALPSIHPAALQMHSVLNLLNRIALVPGTPDRSIEACSLLAAHLTAVYQASSILKIGEAELNRVACSFSELHCWLKLYEQSVVTLNTDGREFEGDVATLLISLQNMINSATTKEGGRFEFHLDNDFKEHHVRICLMNADGMVEQREVRGTLSTLKDKTRANVETRVGLK